MASVKLPQLLLRADREVRIVYTSPLMQVLIGTDPAGLIGEPVTAVSLPNDAAQRLAEACRAVLERRAPVVASCTLLTLDDDQRWECTLCPEFDADGAVDAISVIVQEARAPESAALAAETHLHDVLEHSRDLIYRLNLRSGIYDLLSRSAQMITGYAASELLDLGVERLWARIHPDDRGRFLEHTEALLSGEGAPDDEVLEFRFRHVDGEYRWLSDSRAVIRDAQGAAVALAGSLRDVTLQKRVQNKQAKLLEALAASRERLEQVVRQMPIGVTIADAATGNLIMANEEALRVLGRALGDTVGRRGAILGAMHPDGRPYRADEYPQARALQRGEVVVGEEVLCRRGDGAKMVLSVTSAPIYDQERRVVAAVSTLTDISERKRAEEALRDSERRFRAAIEHFPGIVAIYDAERRIQFINSAGLQLCRRPEAEVLGRRDDEVFPPEVAAEYAPLLTEALATGAVQRTEQTVPEALGGRTFLREFVTLPDAEGQPARVLAVAYDISKRREAERQLEELNDTLEQRVLERTTQLRALAAELVDAEQRERRRLAQVLHDHLQQLLVAARINASLLLQQATSDELRPVLEQLDRLLEQSIEASRTLTIDLSPPVLYDLGLPAALHWLARSMHEKHGLGVEVDADDRANPAATNTRVLLFQAARELLFNVVKHSGVNAARVTLRKHDDRIWMYVADDGVGFDPDRALGPATGSGFGLFSLRERLELLGGSLAIESAPGRGVTISIAAPIELHAPDDAAIGAPVEPGAPPNPSGPSAWDSVGNDRIRILLADDHPILRRGLATMLQSQIDLEIVGEASDGREAIDLARALEPDVVLMDVSMPVMDGIEATRHIRGALANVQVIGLSMHDEVDMAERMRRAGACAYVAKSGDTEALLKAIRHCRAVARPTVKEGER